MITQAGAQALHIGLEGGLQGMHYSLQNGDSKPQAGGALSIGYTYRLNRNWDLLAGVSGGVYRTEATLKDGVVFTSNQVDDGGSAFEYSVKTTGYKETQRYFAASIPVLLQYHTTDEGVQWFFDGGGKVFVPFSTNVQASARQLALSGYYPDYNIDVSNLPQHGFGTIDNWKSSATAQLKPSVAVSAATGASFPLLPGTRLYAGVFVDYGLTSLLKKGESKPFASYSSTGVSGVQAGSVLNLPSTGKATLLSFGLQLRVSFGLSRPKRAGQGVTTQPSGIKDSLMAEQRLLIEEPVVFGLLGESTIPEIQKDHLDEVADLMKQFPRIRISLVGHICGSDTEPEEQKVGVDRAKAVAQYLRNKGIDGSRMDVSPTSESDVVEPFNPLANFRNRRVVVKVE
jgi:outer membrane protein OmpA-like peptidoglycan-associated protein